MAQQLTGTDQHLMLLAQLLRPRLCTCNSQWVAGAKAQAQQSGQQRQWHWQVKVSCRWKGMGRECLLLCKFEGVARF